MKVDVVFAAWYRRADWPAIRAMSADKAGMAADFDVWQNQARAAVSDRLAKGQRVIRVEVSPHDLASFAARSGVQIDGHCRSALAAALGREIQDGTRSECPID